MAPTVLGRQSGLPPGKLPSWAAAPEGLLERIEQGVDFALVNASERGTLQAPPNLRTAGGGRRLLRPARLVDFKPALLHADLGPEHLLVRDGRLAGVIDWGDARLGDPALDYAWLLNGPFADWGVDPDLRRRARFYYRLVPWFEAHYGVFTNRPAHVERGLAGVADRLGARSDRCEDGRCGRARSDERR